MHLSCARLSGGLWWYKGEWDSIPAKCSKNVASWDHDNHQKLTTKCNPDLFWQSITMCQTWGGPSLPSVLASPTQVGTGKQYGRVPRAFQSQFIFECEHPALCDAWCRFRPRGNMPAEANSLAHDQNISRQQSLDYLQTSASVTFLLLHVSGYNGLSYFKRSQIIVEQVDFNYPSHPVF